MKSLFPLLILICILRTGIAQPAKKAHQDTLISPQGTIKIQFRGMKEPVTFSKTARDTIDFGTDGEAGMFAMIYYGKDSMRIENSNFPYYQAHYFPIKLAGKPYTFRLRYNAVPAYFSADYILKHEGKVQIEVPEVFELANILLLLSPSGQRAANMDKAGDYYNEVLAYFKPHLNHPVFKSLDFPEKDFYRNYYDFRENSLCFNFEGDKIIPSKTYFYVMGDDYDAFSSLFKRNLSAIQDFADTSDYRKFYQAHTDFYQKQIARQTELIETRKMWTWMEKEFPKRKLDAYKLIFSPIILSSHSTQQFFGTDRKKNKSFGEAVMFVSGPGSLDRNNKLGEKQKQGTQAGIVFTEIDHNYVNPRSSDFAQDIDSIFDNRSFWTEKKGDNTFYGSAMSVFNEYMTHALFLVYVLDHYDAETARFLIINRKDLMVNRRGFSKFSDFSNALIKIKAENQDTPVYSLYPKMLDWCKAFAGQAK